MKNIVIKIIILLFLSFSAHSKSNIVGAWGSFDCGEMLSKYDSGEAYKEVIQTYMNGMLTGLFISTNTVTYSSQPALVLTTINYCRANPLKTFHKAIVETFIKVNEPN